MRVGSRRLQTHLVLAAACGFAAIQLFDPPVLIGIGVALLALGLIGGYWNGVREA